MAFNPFELQKKIYDCHFLDETNSGKYLIPLKNL